MTPQQQKRIGKFLSLLLRHRPEVLGIELDAQGWTDVEILLQKLSATDKAISREELEALVAANNKQRYAFNEDRIAASGPSRGIPSKSNSPISQSSHRNISFTAQLPNFWRASWPQACRSEVGITCIFPRTKKPQPLWEGVAASRSSSPSAQGRCIGLVIHFSEVAMAYG